MTRFRPGPRGAPVGWAGASARVDQSNQRNCLAQQIRRHRQAPFLKRYGYDGQRVVGYGNERGKGDHKHLGALETRYKFESVDKMIADFLRDVERMKNEHYP